jgi:5-formyltetrahydrofolate cyclo-ligase
MNQDLNSIRERKKEIRKEQLRRLRDQGPSLREERSRKIQEKLLSSEEFRAAGTVMTYVSLPTEVNTYYFIEKALERGKRVAVPYIEPNDQTIIASELAAIENLEKGPFGIYQPREGLAGAIPLKEIDLIVVPLVAYDAKNMRLGRGKGYYDKLLANKDLSSAKTVGLAFHFQVVDSLPSNSHDRPVSRVITD